MRSFACVVLLFVAALAWSQETQPTTETPIPEQPGEIVAPAESPAAAPVRVSSGAKLFIEEGDFGVALTAALTRKKVPVLVVSNPAKADFVVRYTAEDRKASKAEKVARIAFGMWGGGDRYHASVTFTNRDDVVVFAYSAKKGNFQNCAQNVATNLKKHIEGKN